MLQLLFATGGHAAARISRTGISLLFSRIRFLVVDGANTSRCAMYITQYFRGEFTGPHWADNPVYDPRFVAMIPNVVAAAGTRE